MSKNEERKWNPNEIPGFTSYLTDKHRFRKPEEYVNFWKWEEKAQSMKTELGLPAETTENELCEVIINQQGNLQAYKNELREVEGAKLTLAASVTQLEERVRKLQVDLQTAIEEGRNDKEERLRLQTLLDKHGTHAGDCDWVIMLQSGRLHGTEEEHCTCGWHEVQF